MHSRNHQEVNRRLRVNVLDHHSYFVLQHDFGRGLVVNDPAKDAVFHKSLQLIQSNDVCFCGKSGLAQLLGELPSAVLSGFVTYAHSVVETIAAIKALDDDGVKARTDPGLEPLGIVPVPKGAYLDGVDARLTAGASRRRQSQYLQLHARDSRPNHIDGASAGIREVYDAALHEGATIVDAHRHVAAVVEVVDSHLSIEGERAMRSRQFIHVIDFAV